LSGALSDVISNEFILANVAQWVVDIKSSDVAFKSDDCGTWSTSPRPAPASGIPPGLWLVGSQVPAGTYRTSASSGCYWARLKSFDGTSSEILANDFMGSAGQALVQLQSSDVGFENDSDCGTWSRSTGLETPSSAQRQPRSSEDAWRAHRLSHGLQ